MDDDEQEIQQRERDGAELDVSQRLRALGRAALLMAGEVVRELQQAHVASIDEGDRGIDVGGGHGVAQ